MNSARVLASAALGATVLLGAGPAFAADYTNPGSGDNGTQVLGNQQTRPVVVTPAQPVVVQPAVAPATTTRTLAFTGGTAVVGGLVLGTVLLAGGSALVVVGRRRESGATA